MAIAGNIYKHKKTKKSAVVSGLVAALVMGIVSVFSNYFVVYPGMITSAGWLPLPYQPCNIPGKPQNNWKTH